MSDDRIWDKAAMTPLAPTTLIVSDITTDGFKLEWVQPDDGFAPLAVMWEVAASGEVKATMPAAGRPGAIIRGLRRPDRTYDVHVVAIDERGNRSAPGRLAVMTVEP